MMIANALLAIALTTQTAGIFPPSDPQVGDLVAIVNASDAPAGSLATVTRKIVIKKPKPYMPAVTDPATFHRLSRAAILAGDDYRSTVKLNDIDRMITVDDSSLQKLASPAVAKTIYREYQAKAKAFKSKVFPKTRQGKIVRAKAEERMQAEICKLYKIARWELELINAIGTTNGWEAQ